MKKEKVTIVLTAAVKTSVTVAAEDCSYHLENFGVHIEDCGSRVDDE